MHIIFFHPTSQSSFPIINFWVLITRLRIASLVEFPSHIFPLFYFAIFSANINKEIFPSKNCITNENCLKILLNKRKMPQFPPPNPIQQCSCICLHIVHRALPAVWWKTKKKQRLKEKDYENRKQKKKK